MINNVEEETGLTEAKGTLDVSTNEGYRAAMDLVSAQVRALRFLPVAELLEQIGTVEALAPISETDRLQKRRRRTATRTAAPPGGPAGRTDHRRPDRRSRRNGGRPVTHQAVRGARQHPPSVDRRPAPPPGSSGVTSPDCPITADQEIRARAALAAATALGPAIGAAVTGPFDPDDVGSARDVLIHLTETFTHLIRDGSPPATEEENTMPAWQDLGEQHRRRLGIDGTAGDAQDVPHPYTTEPPYAQTCVVCGLAETWRKHTASEET